MRRRGGARRRAYYRLVHQVLETSLSTTDMWTDVFAVPGKRTWGTKHSLRFFYPDAGSVTNRVHTDSVTAPFP